MGLGLDSKLGWISWLFFPCLPSFLPSFLPSACLLACLRAVLLSFCFFAFLPFLPFCPSVFLSAFLLFFFRRCFGPSFRSFFLSVLIFLHPTQPQAPLSSRRSWFSSTINEYKYKHKTQSRNKTRKKQMRTPPPPPTPHPHPPTPTPPPPPQQAKKKKTQAVIPANILTPQTLNPKPYTGGNRRRTGNKTVNPNRSP